MPDPDLRTRGEAALVFRTSARTIKRLAVEGKLDEVYIAPRSPRITAASIQRHLERIGALEPGPGRPGTEGSAGAA
jgi:hypothetical protein